MTCDTSTPLLIAAVADLHVADAKAGGDEHENCDNDKTRHSNPDGRGFSDNGEGSFRHGHGGKRLEIMNDADLLKQRRQEKVEPLPAIKDERGNDWIAEK